MNIALISIGILRNPKEASRITLLGIAQEFTKKSHSVVIITEKAPDLPTIEKLGNNLIIYRPYKLPFISKILSYSFAIHSAQKRTKVQFDIIHSFSATPLFVLSSFITKLFAPKAKIIHTLRSYSRSKWGNRGYFLLNLAYQITVPTKIFQKRIKTVSKKKISVIHSPLNTTKFFPQDKEKLKQKYGYANQKIVMHYGAVWENKGANNLIKSIPQIARNNPKILFLFLPRYKNIEKQLQLVKEYQVEKYVQFITEDVNIEDYVNLADVIALPYINLLGTEGNPSCLLEAMACKTPVVTTNLPELKEIADGCIFFAKPGDIDSLAETILTALENPNKQMIEKAYKQSQIFNVEKTAKEFEELYKQP